MIISMEHKDKREYECGSFKRNSSVAPFSLFIFFLYFFYFVFFWWPQWLFLFNSHFSSLGSFNLPSLGSFPHLSAILYFTRSIEYIHTLQGTQHKEDVAIIMYANVCLCQWSGNMYDMKIKS